MAVDSAATKAELAAILVRVTAAAPKVAALGALIVQAAGQKNTHVLTGSLRRSWATDSLAAVQETSLGFSARTGPTMIYARRQELGFVGPDSIGRIFRNDPGWPYVRPAAIESIPAVLALANALYAAAIEG